MTRKAFGLAGFVAMAAALLAAPAFGHHAFAMFDQSKTVYMMGTVQQFELVNPHAWLHLAVVNDKGEIIGRIDDFIFGRDNGPVYAVLSVGDFDGLNGELVAVPFKSLKLDDSSGKIVLPGASREALRKLPVFLYNR